MTLTSDLLKTISNRLGTPETTTIVPKFVKIGARNYETGLFLLKEAAIFDWPKGGLNGVEKVEPYDFLILQLLNLQFPPLTQFGHKNLANPFLVT